MELKYQHVTVWLLVRVKQGFLAIMPIFRSPRLPSILVSCELVKVMEKYFAHKFLEDEKSLVTKGVFRKVQYTK